RCTRAGMIAPGTAPARTRPVQGRQAMRTPTNRLLTVLAAAGVSLGLAAAGLHGQPPAKGGPKSAEEAKAADLGKEFLKGRDKAAKKYQGKTLRVRGTADSTADNLVYVKTGLQYPQGQPVLIIFKFPEGSKPEVSAGQEVVLEGKFEREAVLGPSFGE